MNGEYHSRDGFYFRRVNDVGAVAIRVATSNDFDAPNAREIVLEASEWASVVAAVSKPGEDGRTYRAAQDLHQGLEI